MKINVGCGEFPAPGWLNLDIRHPAADLHWDATTGLPPTDEPIERIYAGHVLEHLERDEVTATVAKWREHPQVGPQTRLAVVGPDCDVAAKWVLAGRLSEEDYADMESGANRWTGDAHRWRCTGPQTVALVAEGGWTVSYPQELDWLRSRGWPLTSLIGWQFGALATLEER